VAGGGGGAGILTSRDRVPVSHPKIPNFEM
jgi:hypothetical protein